LIPVWPWFRSPHHKRRQWCQRLLRHISMVALHLPV